MAASSYDFPHNFVGFVNDLVSEKIIDNVIQSIGLAYSQVQQKTLPEIIEFLKNNRTPKILMIDISDSELPLGDIARIRECCTPDVGIVTIGSRNDVGLFRDLMAMGVVDYLIKPLNYALLHRAIELANGKISEYTEKMGKMVLFVSSVGGAGATTAITNVAWILANRHFKRTLVVDMDFLYGTANLMLDVKAGNTFLDNLESPDKIDGYFVDLITKKCGQRLYYLGGLVDLMRGVNVDMEVFDKLMIAIKRQFNYVLLDTQRDISAINRICRAKADSFTVMVEMSMASAQNTVRILELLHTEYPGKQIIIVANKMGLSSGGALSKESFERIIDRKIDYSMHLDETTALAAANIGQPLAMSNNPITDVLEAITDAFLGKRSNQEIERAIIEEHGWTMARIKNLVIAIVDQIIARLK
ncbi:MAG: AAA family ATPase [Holosporaceae bacterium]|jgi:pilus assembly protein CpaE|nr:AAA family ATPase [Holosporaceae bacterium]